MDERFTDPVLELTRRLSYDPEGTLDLALETSNEDAQAVLDAIHETEAELAAGDIVARLRRQGHTL